VVDAAGDVIATGALRSALGSYEAAVVKLAGASGAELWRNVRGTAGRSGSGSAERAAVDPGGDVVVTGHLGLGTNLDLGVWKLAGGDGAIRWLRELDAGSNEDTSTAGGGVAVFRAAHSPVPDACP
jgi:hypothetical protein